jgi:hypothetical protein
MEGEAEKLFEKVHESLKPEALNTILNGKVMASLVMEYQHYLEKLAQDNGIKIKVELEGGFILHAEDPRPNVSGFKITHKTDQSILRVIEILTEKHRQIIPKLMDKNLKELGCIVAGTKALMLLMEKQSEVMQFIAKSREAGMYCCERYAKVEDKILCLNLQFLGGLREIIQSRSNVIITIYEIKDNEKVKVNTYTLLVNSKESLELINPFIFNTLDRE